MPRKRIKGKKKKINLRILTHDLYESICDKVSLVEMLRDYDYNNVGAKYSYWFMFDKNDPEKCKEVWDLHKEAVMEKWKLDKNNAGKRPFLWWVCERPEDIKIIRYEKYKDFNGKPEPREMWPDGHIETEYPIYEGETAYLRRLNLLREDEIKIFDSDELCHRDEENSSLPYWEIKELKKDDPLPIEE